MSLSCRLCGEPIKFDDKHISKTTGKKIPLDADTDEPHDCAAWRSSNNQQQSQQTQRRYYQCNKGCSQEIYFDANNENGRSQSGKWIPLSKDTGQLH